MRGFLTFAIAAVAIGLVTVALANAAERVRLHLIVTVFDEVSLAQVIAGTFLAGAAAGGALAALERWRGLRERRRLQRRVAELESRLGASGGDEQA